MIKQKMIDTDDIRHEQGPYGIKSYLVNPNKNIYNNYNTYLNIKPEYQGPWKLYVDNDHLYSDCSVIHWAYHVLTPTSGLTHDWGALSANYNKSLYASVDCANLSAGINCIYTAPSGDTISNFLIGTVDTSGNITQNYVNGYLQITNRYL